MSEKKVNVQEEGRPVYVMQDCYQPDSDDEIDLISLVAVLWRRKAFIILFTVLITGAAVGYALMSTPIYRVKAIVSPGVVGFDESGLPIGSPSLAEIKEWLGDGAYMAGMISKYSITAAENGTIPSGNALTIKLPRNGQLLGVSLDTPDPKNGEKMIGSILEILTAQQVPYTLAVQKKKKQIADMELDLAAWYMKEGRHADAIERTRRQILIMETSLAAMGKNIAEQQKIIGRLSKQSEEVNANTRELIGLREDLVKVKGDKLSLLMYTNIIQQNMTYAISLEQRMDGLRTSLIDRELDQGAKEIEIKNMHLKLKDMQEKQTKELADAKIKAERNLAALKKQLAQLSPLTVVQKPLGSLRPVKPAKRKIVALAMVGSFFLAVMLAFMLEFWKNNKSRLNEK